MYNIRKWVEDIQIFWQMRLSLADSDAPLTHLDVKRARKNELEQNYLQMFRLSVLLLHHMEVKSSKVEK